MGALGSFRSVVRFKSIETNRVTRRLMACADLDDVRRVAKRRLPAGVFDYIDGGAEDESALRRNRERFGDIELVPRVLRDVSSIDTTTELLGHRRPLPLVLSPTGFTRIADSQGELAVARAAARAGVPYALSTMGTRSIEEVAEVSPGPKWFQVYTWRDRALVAELLARAHAAGYEAVILTVDTAVLGRRERDVRRGYTLPPKVGLGTLLEGVIRPEWSLDFLTHEPITFANVAGGNAAGDGSTAVTLADYINTQFDPALSWDDVAWIRGQWSGPLVLKGIQSVPDAIVAADLGVDAIALSNHGGRQLDAAPTPVELLAPVADAVGGRTEILCDGGVRRGSDIVKAVALGATAVMVGRPYLYGLGAAGERGVDFVLSFLADGMRQTMALSGVTSVAELTPDLVRCRW